MPVRARQTHVVCDPGELPIEDAPDWAHRLWHRVLCSWPVRGYREANGSRLVAIVAFNALVALVPTLLLLTAAAGLVLRDQAAFEAAVDAIVAAFPDREAGEALDAVISVRSYPGWIGAVSLLGFLWIGTTFADAVAHCLNRVHGVPDCGYVCTRRKGFAVVLGVAGLFMAAAAAGLPTLLAGPRPAITGPDPAIAPVARPFLGALVGTVDVARIPGYAVAFVVAAALFLMLYRVLPNAGQRLGDVWPGALVAGALFVLLGQAFPIYLRLAGGANRFGVAFGLAWLLVTWFGALGHVLLFGAHINATRLRRRQRRTAASPTRLDEPFRDESPAPAERGSRRAA